MNIKILKENESEIEIVIEKNKPTIFMLLKEELDNNPNVIMCAWKEDHPLKKNIYFYLKTNGTKKPRDLILESIQNLIKKLKEFENKYNKEVYG
ncbi:MAG: RpoL/Rpb11 RNA polymerase subunit family protein [Candidatus Aenigmatarchaeota archaeon]